MANVLVIGCVSKDVIHLERTSDRVNTIGGAGLYTALAVRALGVGCTLLAPRPEKPDAKFAEIASKVDWIGPTVSDELMPSLEIIHHGEDRATLKDASWGGESKLTPESLPENLASFNYVHIAALSSAKRQLEFLQALRHRAPSSKISAGTYARAVAEETDAVRELLTACDLFFMNENEANLLSLSSPENVLRTSNHAGQTYCITRGKNGVSIYTARGAKNFAGIAAAEVDPTGAGDTFCGTLLAGLAKGMSIDTSALMAVERAARVITEPGPLALQRLIK